jgi:hypothetical protein
MAQGIGPVLQKRKEKKKLKKGKRCVWPTVL